MYEIWYPIEANSLGVSKKIEYSDYFLWEGCEIAYKSARLQVWSFVVFVFSNQTKWDSSCFIPTKFMSLQYLLFWKETAPACLGCLVEVRIYNSHEKKLDYWAISAYVTQRNLKGIGFENCGKCKYPLRKVKLVGVLNDKLGK